MSVWSAHSLVRSGMKGRVVVCAIGNVEARLIGGQLSGKERVCKHSISQSVNSEWKLGPCSLERCDMRQYGGFNAGVAQ